MKLDGTVVAADFKARIDALGWTWEEACRRARVSRSTPVRWAKGTRPTRNPYKRMEAAIRRAEKRAAE